MPSDREQKQFETLVSHLKELRNEVNRAEMQLFREADRIEQTQKKLWSQFYKTFDALLEDNNICDSRRYRDYLAAEPQVGGPGEADAMGGPGPVIEAARITDPKRREKYVEAAKKRFEARGVPWSEQEAKSQRKNIGGTPPKDSNWNRKADREAQLYAENLDLKKQVRELTRQLREKDEEIAQLRKSSGKKKPVAVQPQA